ncbi:hypothetical protein HELRODRAFT_172570 [Helobdella robusta]|uniref:Uncharacterized protein n=1 Tax=Helobdella robusta TaxID=6412 RepID=T1F5J3_HELRO|nr:hypothetical protein HELRODRAFT_172570 [Helobdella robusta]ESO04220.1 hypothetical protein HELRODRAFT_172570 [Helobdella robusta]
MSSMRSDTICDILGPYDELNERQLPTIGDVIKFILFVKNDLKLKCNGKDLSKKIQNIWIKASIPIVSNDRVLQLLKSYFEKYLTLKRYPKSKRHDSFEKKLKCFSDLSKRLFDVASCKCVLFEACVCLKNKKVPVNERQFLIDQRNERKMAIGGIDKQETVRLRKRQARQFERSMKGVKKFCSTQGSNIVSTALEEDETHINFSKTNLATETLLTNLSFTNTPTTSFANRNLLQLPTLAKVCDRYRLSTRSAAAVASAVLVDVDGCTSGPREYPEPIEKQLATCENKTTLLFQPLTGHLPDLTKNVVNELSIDQKYLYEICQAVLTGSCSPELANRQPGNLSHSRWLTCANRLLRLYVSTPDPSESLQILVEYVVKVYAPIWFSIKQKTSFKDGAKHIFNLILFSRYLPTNLRTIVIERNAFYAHPENLLVSMLFDDRDYIRELACRRIIKARNTDNGFKQKIFKTPKLNFSAKDYTEIISWQECQVTVTPVLRDVTNDELKKMAKDGSLKIVDFPCHTQSVERCVKLVTEASQSVTNVNSRDGFVRTTLQSRAEFPIFGHKNIFKF